MKLKPLLVALLLPASALAMDEIIGDWAVKNGIKKVATLTSDYAPGNDALTFFKQHFTAGGGEIVEEVKVPLANPDFAPFLQRMKDSKPDAMFVFVPAGQGGKGRLADKPPGVAGEHGGDSGPALHQQTREGRRLVGRDPPGHSQHDLRLGDVQRKQALPGHRCGSERKPTIYGNPGRRLPARGRQK
jgi:hypothetical protein